MLYALIAQSIYVIYITESILKKGESVDALLKEIVAEHFWEVNYFSILFCKSLFLGEFLTFTLLKSSILCQRPLFDIQSILKANKVMTKFLKPPLPKALFNMLKFIKFLLLNTM